MRKKISLIAIGLSVLAIIVCLLALVQNFLYDETGNSLMLLILTGLSIALLGSNYSYYKKYKDRPDQQEDSDQK